MNAIVAFDENFSIGKDNQLLFHIINDMKRFKELTIGKVVVMGRKTFESLPNQKPLKDRINFILSTDKSLKVDGAIIVNSSYEFLSKYAYKYNQNDIFIIGGSRIFDEFKSAITKFYITKVNAKFPDATTFFNNELFQLDNWSIIEKEENLIDNESGLHYNFYTYTL